MLFATAAAAAAQVASVGADELAALLAAERTVRASLQAELVAERKARIALEARVDRLEGERQRSAEDESIRAQLSSMIAPDEFADTAPHTVVPPSFNPRISVFTDAVIDAGDFDETRGRDDGDRFSLRETVIDLRLPIAPWGEGVLITAFEDLGNSESETKIEEAYIDLDLGGNVLDSDPSGTRMKVGRFRAPFGHDNKLHIHDLPQADRPAAVQYLLGEEGLIGDGLEFTVPVSHRTNSGGLESSSTASLALVNGDMFASEESALGSAVADTTGIELGSDAPLVVARWAEYRELSPTSNLEFGVSAARSLGSQAVQAADGAVIEAGLYGADLTWRHAPDETGVGSWLVQAEAVHSELDLEGFMPVDLADGSRDAGGWWLTVQRRMSEHIDVGVRVGETDMLLDGGDVREINPYVSWYLDEGFRVRLQGQHLDIEEAGGGETDARRLLLQFTWHFGAHSSHHERSHR